jgi:predicted Rossmann fold nucleotide-binding protein DprA/Smf involved in DNA uptake
MQRNKLVYALADAALVVNADLDRGGTWAGATEQLDKLRLVPVYVRSTGEPAPGLEALQRRGALPWPDPADADGLDAALRAAAPVAFVAPAQGELSFEVQEAASEAAARRAGTRE